MWMKTFKHNKGWMFLCHQQRQGKGSQHWDEQELCYCHCLAAILLSQKCELKHSQAMKVRDVLASSADAGAMLLSLPSFLILFSFSTSEAQEFFHDITCDSDIFKNKTNA